MTTTGLRVWSASGNEMSIPSHADATVNGSWVMFTWNADGIHHTHIYPHTGIARIINEEKT